MEKHILKKGSRVYSSIKAKRENKENEAKTQVERQGSLDAKMIKQAVNRKESNYRMSFVLEKAALGNESRNKTGFPRLSQISKMKKEVSTDKHQKDVFLSQIKDLFSKEVIQAMVSQKLIKRNSSENMIIKKQVLNDLLVKTASIFLANGGYDQLEILDESFTKLNTIVSAQNEKHKKSSNNICSKTLTVNFDFALNQYMLAQQSQIGQLTKERRNIEKEIKELQNQRQKIRKYVFERFILIQTANRELRERQSQLSKVRQCQEDARKTVQRLSLQMIIIQQEYDKIVNFVEKQVINQHIKNAKEVYLQIESEMFEHAVYCQHNQLANDQDFKSIPMLNQQFVLMNLAQSMKAVNKTILGDKHSLEEKLKVMRDFVVQVDSRHWKLNAAYEELFRFKSKQINKYVNLMKRYLQNWELKQEYLVNLRKEFGIDSAHLKQEIQHLFSEDTCKFCSQRNTRVGKNIEAIYLKIEENYKYGNSFY